MLKHIFWDIVIFLIVVLYILPLLPDIIGFLSTVIGQIIKGKKKKK